LFYLDTKEVSGTVLLTTVADKRTKYTNRSYKQAMLARKVQNMIGRPSLRTYLKIVDENLLKNCPISRPDVLAAEDILVPNLGSLKGKTIRRGESRVPTAHEVVPRGIMERTSHYVST
jgi:hypothetical protein